MSGAPRPCAELITSWSSTVALAVAGAVRGVTRIVQATACAGRHRPMRSTPAALASATASPSAGRDQRHRAPEPRPAAVARALAPALGRPGAGRPRCSSTCVDAPDRRRARTAATPRSPAAPASTAKAADGGRVLLAVRAPTDRITTRVVAGSRVDDRARRRRRPDAHRGRRGPAGRLSRRGAAQRPRRPDQGPAPDGLADRRRRRACSPGRPIVAATGQPGDAPSSYAAADHGGDGRRRPGRPGRHDPQRRSRTSPPGSALAGAARAHRASRSRAGHRRRAARLLAQRPIAAAVGAGRADAAAVGQRDRRVPGPAGGDRPPPTGVVHRGGDRGPIRAARAGRRRRRRHDRRQRACRRRPADSGRARRRAAAGVRAATSGRCARSSPRCRSPAWSGTLADRFVPGPESAGRGRRRARQDGHAHRCLGAGRPRPRRRRPAAGRSR